MGSIFNLQVANSSTYADQLAIQLGLFQDRLAGETADHFLDRLYSSAYSRRDHTLEGTINNIAYQLGLSSQVGLTVTGQDPGTIINVGAGQITFTPTTGAQIIVSTVTISNDNMWVWCTLGEVASSINQIANLTATTVVPDTLAIQLVPQTSINCSIAESVSGASSFLDFDNITIGSELFSNPVPDYELDYSVGALTFSSAPASGTKISYIYNIAPFNMACSQVGVINLTDPALQTTALCPDGSMVYQMREFNQAILQADNCYWG
jgi:hypothetical protein